MSALQVGFAIQIALVFVLFAVSIWAFRTLLRDAKDNEINL